MHVKSILSNIYLKIIAALFIFSGFGMIHATSQYIEKMGSILIGIGAFYFIVLLLVIQNKKNNSVQKE